MTATNPDSQRPGVVNAAFYIILILGILSLIAIPWNPGGVIQAPLYLIVAWGIRRERAWSAYGLALLTLVLTAVPFAGGMLREQSLVNVKALTLGVAVAFSLALVILLFFAGRAMERHYGRRGRAWPWIAGSVFACGFFLLFGLFQMPTGSMENTLLVGDRITVWKTHSKVPARGDIVVHIYPVNRNDTFVKRVVALPGDRVRIVNKQLFINGSAVSEPYAEHKTSYVDSYRDNFPSEANVKLYPAATEMLANNVVNGEVVVPPHRYFVLGDNRDLSLDSRYWGFIDQSDIVNKEAEEMRRIGALGGRARARNVRLRKRRQMAVTREFNQPHQETAAEAIRRIDALCPCWLVRSVMRHGARADERAADMRGYVV